jgi:hypothetical protein
MESNAASPASHALHSNAAVTHASPASHALHSNAAVTHASQTPTAGPDPQTRKRKIHCKQELIISSLQRFYSGRDDLDEIVELLKGTSEVSLRLIDWFVTNFSKAHSTSYILNGQEFVVYMNYKNQLKAYSKKLFDPFCRRERISFQIPGHEAFLTTVGKLNFFRWALEKGILNYIKGNQVDIEKEMNTAMREQNKQRLTTRDSTATTETTATLTTTSSSQTRKRNTNSEPSAIKLLQKHDCQIEMRFD